MATTSLQNLMSYVYLTDGVKTRSSKVANPFPDEFWQETKVPGLAARVPQFFGTRRTARLTAYGSPGRRRQFAPLPMQDFVLYSVFEETLMPSSLLNMLRSRTTYDHDKAREEVDMQIEIARDELQNTRVGALCSMLNPANGGNAYFDADGNLLQNNTGSVFNLSMQLAAANLNQLGGIISASWATATTDIPSNVRNLQKQSATDTGYNIEYAFYGKDIPSYLMNNNYVKEWVVRNPSTNASYLESLEIPDGFLGVKKWIPTYKCVYDKFDGTKQSLFADDGVAFTVNPKYWYKLFGGTRLIPKTIQIYKDISEAMGNLTEVQGMFSYAYLDPQTVELFMMTGDTCLPACVNNAGVYLADVVP